MTTFKNAKRMSKKTRVNEMIAGTDMGPYLRKALTSSLKWADAYEKTHCFTDAGMGFQATATLALGRLEWLLREGRQSLAGVITAKDFMVLCNTFQGEMAELDDDYSLASAVAYDNGVDHETYEESGMRPLLEKLMRLSALERLALRDLVERFWYMGITQSSSIAYFLKKNGLTEVSH